MEPLKHLQKRKNIKKYAPHPHPKKVFRIMDFLIYVATVIVPAVTFIQAYEIWTYKDATGVSLITFAGYVLTNFIWLSYGIIHREKPITIMYILLAIANSSIVLGILAFS